MAFRLEISEAHSLYNDSIGHCSLNGRKGRAPWHETKDHGSHESHQSLDEPNRQSPIASVQRTRLTLLGHSAGPRGMNTTATNANRAIRMALQRTQGLRGPKSFFSGEI